jgi:hypothetical protein
MLKERVFTKVIKMPSWGIGRRGRVQELQMINLCRVAKWKRMLADNKYM